MTPLLAFFKQSSDSSINLGGNQEKCRGHSNNICYKRLGQFFLYDSCVHSISTSYNLNNYIKLITPPVCGRAYTAAATAEYIASAGIAL